jgi:hypothetical protein
VSSKQGQGKNKQMFVVNNVLFLSARQFQTESSVVRGNTLHHIGGHSPRGVQGEIA